jgi:tRNA1(Val) A37 N6-methylase TrmN6
VAEPDRLLGGKLLLRQPERGHRAGTDAVLLAAAAGAPSGLMVDLGAGVGTVGLAVALRSPVLRVKLVEIDAASAARARENVALNGLADRVEVVEGDALSGSVRREKGLEGVQADLIVTNPPWYAPGRFRTSPEPDRARAHTGLESQDDPDGLAAWLRAAAAMLKPGGKLVAILHGGQLPELLAASRGRFGGLCILPVHPRADDDAARLLVCGVRGSRAPLRLRPGLVLHAADGRFTPLAEAIHRGEALIELG